MASIKSQMTLDDGMSRVLTKITHVLDTTLKCFEDMQGAMGESFDAELIQSCHIELAEVNNDIRSMETYLARAKDREDELNESFSRGTQNADDLLQKVTAIGTAALSFGLIKNLIEEALENANTQLSAEVQLNTVMGNMGTLRYYDKVLDKAADIQRHGMFGDEAMIAGAAELATYFSDADAILSMMDTLTDYAAGMSLGDAVDAKQMTDYATNLGKIMTGTYTAMSQKGFEFTEAQKAIIEGTATQAQVVEALGAEYVSMSNDMQAAAVINDIIGESFGHMYEAMSNTPKGKLQALKNTFGDLSESVGIILYPAVMGVAKALGWVADNIEIITPLVIGLGAAFLVFQVAAHWTEIAAAATAIYHGVINFLSIGFGVLTGNTAAASAAVFTFNSALLASPITWIIMALLVLIGVLYAVVAIINKVTGSSISATGIICGAVAVALAFIGNAAIGLLNALLQWAWNFVAPFLSIVEFILNVCNGGFDSFGDAVANLIGQIISWFLNLGKVVTKIIDAIFGTNWTAGLNSLADAVTAWGKNENAITLEKNAPTIDYRFEYGDAWDAGYDFGEGLANKVGDLGDMGYYMDGIGDDTADIADSTAKTAGALTVSNETLEYLRDIAERDAINRFTTAEVKIDMTGMTNRIEGEADLDGVLSTLTDGFAEALVVAAEGVHA